MEEAPISKRSTRSRLTYSGGASRSYAESLRWGIRWEGLRSRWFSRFGHWADAEKYLARLEHLEREYADEVNESCSPSASTG
jgi:hypothetical protein